MIHFSGWGYILAGILGVVLILLGDELLGIGVILFNILGALVSIYTTLLMKRN